MMETAQRSIVSALAAVALPLTFLFASGSTRANEFGLGLQGPRNEALGVLKPNVQKGDLPPRWRWSNRSYVTHGRSGAQRQVAVFRVRATSVAGDPRGASSPWSHTPEVPAATISDANPSLFNFAHMTVPFS